MKGGFEGWLLGAVVWVLASTGNYFCDKWEVGCECEQALDSQLTPKSRRCRSVVQLDAHPAFGRRLGKLHEPGLPNPERLFAMTAAASLLLQNRISEYFSAVVDDYLPLNAAVGTVDVFTDR